MSLCRGAARVLRVARGLFEAAAVMREALLLPPGHHGMGLARRRLPAPTGPNGQRRAR